MIHHRQKIREEFASEVRAATVGLVHSVIASAYLPQRALPVVCVFTDSEQSTFVNDRLERIVSVTAKAIVAAASGADDALDEICAAIESAIDPRLGGLTDDGKLRTTRFEIEQDEQATWQIMSASLTYRFLYATSATIPGSAI